MKLWHRHQLIITCKLCEDCRADLVQSILTTTCAALSWNQERSRNRQPVPPDNYLELNTMINLASARKLSHFFYRLFRLMIQSWFYLLLAVLSVLRHHQMHCCLKTEGNTKKHQLDNSKLGSPQQWMTLTCCQDHILTENIWFVWSETSYNGDERRCCRCGTNEQ